MRRVVLSCCLFLLSCAKEPAPQKIEIPPPVIEQQQEIVIVKPKPTRQELLSPLIDQIRQQEKEMLPFDEPKHEHGEQLDGSLRIEWQRAYNHRKSFYEFNGDRYSTMYKGKPFVPQVCSDFIVDTIDRTAGTWYRSSLKYPGKIKGNYDLRAAMKEKMLDPRRLNELMAFFKSEPENFQFIFEGTGHLTKDTTKLKTWMKSLDVQVGDIIIFRGRVPWDNGREEHNHSMFVTGLDDQGQVQLVTGNPIYPVERTLRVEGNRTPKRRVVYVVRLTDKFLTTIQGLK